MRAYFKLNRILVLLFSNISVPPMIPFILYGSYKIGGFVLSNPDENIMVDDITWELVYTQIAQYTVGALFAGSYRGIYGNVTYFSYCSNKKQALCLTIFRKPASMKQK